MARVNIRTARKTYTCSRCGDTIAPGSRYRWAKTRYGPKIVRCMKTECDIKQSEMTSSPKLSALYGVAESLEGLVIANYETPEELANDVRGLSEEANEVAEEYRESASNIEDGFGHATMQSEELESKADEVESWANEIENTADGIETIEVVCECEHKEGDHKEVDNGVFCEPCADAHVFVIDAAWQEEAQDLINDVATSIPV